MANIIYRIARKIANIVLSTPLVKINNKKIVFDNFLGKGYGCNPKYITEELIREGCDYELVWLVNDLNCEMPQQIRKVKHGGIRAMYEWATAKIWIDNVRNYKGVNKKKNQFYIQTWHSPLALKKIEAEVENMLSTEYVKAAKNDGKITDLMLVNNRYMEELIRKYFWYDGKIMNIGLPRNDIIAKTTEEIINKVYSWFKLERNTQLVIYAPTFRQNTDGVEVYKFDYSKVCDCLEKKFGVKFAMLLRLHPNVAKYKNELIYTDRIINASDYPDIQELLAVSSVTITDYSSTMFDSSMFGKPVFILAKDLEEYRAKERETEFELIDLPFTVANNEEELCMNIEKFSKEIYNSKCYDFYKKIGLVKNDNASVEVVKIIKEEMQR